MTTGIVSKYSINKEIKSKNLLLSEVMEIVDILTSEKMCNNVQSDYLAAMQISNDFRSNSELNLSDYVIVRGIYTFIFINKKNNNVLNKIIKHAKNCNMVVFVITESEEKVYIDTITEL